jgi:hypothetical protein
MVIPRDLIEEIDRLVGQRKRSAFVVEAIAEKLQRERFGRALAETKGFLSEEAHPEWATPEKTSAWVRALRAVDNEVTNRKLARRD